MTPPRDKFNAVIQELTARAKEIVRAPQQPEDPGLELAPYHRLRLVDLAHYAGRFTQLTQVKPGVWKGKCPVHQEKTASFYVYTGPWRWYCFGASAAGGDIIALKRELRRVGKA